MNFRSIARNWFYHLFAQSGTELAWQDALQQIAAARDPSHPSRSTPDIVEHCDGGFVKGNRDDNDTPAFRIYFASYLCKTRRACSAVNEIPAQLRLRALAVHAFDANAMTVGCEVIEGRDLEIAIARQLADPRAVFLCICSAPRGCYVGRVERPGASGTRRLTPRGVPCACRRNLAPPRA